MKLLFDQNISFRILKLIEEIFPESKQVKMLGLENISDLEIRLYAKSHGYAIVTFDSDFRDLSALYGHPPKIMLLRIGNSTTQNIADILIARDDKIIEFLDNDKYKDISLLEII